MNDIYRGMSRDSRLPIKSALFKFYCGEGHDTDRSKENTLGYPQRQAYPVYQGGSHRDAARSHTLHDKLSLKLNAINLLENRS